MGPCTRLDGSDSEQAPFQVMGDQFGVFRQLCIEGFLAIRRHYPRLLMLLEMSQIAKGSGSASARGLVAHDCKCDQKIARLITCSEVIFFQAPAPHRLSSRSRLKGTPPDWPASPAPHPCPRQQACHVLRGTRARSSRGGSSWTAPRPRPRSTWVARWTPRERMSEPTFWTLSTGGRTRTCHEWDAQV